MLPPRTKPGPTSPAPVTVSPETTAFLTAMYDRAPQGAYLELRPFPPAWAGRGRSNAWRCWRTATDTVGFATYAAKADADQQDVYMGVATRRAQGGTSADVVAVTALWAELDGSPSKKGNGCASKADALARLEALDVKPSIVIDSGGGYHAYWLLEAPITGPDLHDVPLLNARLREALRAEDGTYAGDDVGDLARILRVPGTTNRKRPDEPRRVTVVTLDADVRYTPDLLDHYLPPLPADLFRASGSGSMPSEPGAPITDAPRRREALVRDAGAAWAQCEGHRHFLPLPMARVLLAAGWPWADIPALIGDIAAAGGSADAAQRRDAAAKELGDRAERARVGWPWLRQHTPELAAALDQHTRVDTTDLADLAQHVAALVQQPPPAVESTTMPPPPAARPAPEKPATAISPPTTAPEPKNASKPKLKALAGAATEATEGRAAERIYNLLRDRLAWLGRSQEDARTYGGRKRSDGHRAWVETIALDGREASLWALEVVRSAGLPLTETHRKIALDLLAAEARHTDVDLRLRYARSTGGTAWMVDMGDEHWHRVRIEPGRWSVEAGDGAMFVRTPCTLPYTQPDEHAKPTDVLDGLQALLGCDEEVSAQLACWLVQALHPTAPRMGLLVTGPQGSGKSTFARLARRIIDPATPSLIKFTLAKNKEVDYQTANVHKAMLATVAYSNVSSLNEAASDFLCGLITGDGHIARALYSNVDPVLSEGRRTLIVEGISIVGMGADLQDRLLHLSLPVRTSFEPEAHFEARLAEWMPRIMGGLFAATASAMSKLEDIEENHVLVLNRCRMRDAAAVYGAAAEAFGYDPAVMLTRLVNSRSDSQELEVESDVVGHAFLNWLATARQYNQQADGTVYDNTIEAFDVALQAGQKHDLWPKTPRGFRSKLDRLVPGLRAKGVSIEYYRSKGIDRKACVKVCMVGRADVEPDEELQIIRVTPRVPPPVQDFGPTAEAFLAAHKAFSFAMIPLLMSGRVQGMESWVEPMRALALAPEDARTRLTNFLMRKYPSSLIGDHVWYESAKGATKTWAGWLAANA